MTPFLQVKNLQHIYSIGTPFEHVALKDVSFCVEKGEFVGILKVEDIQEWLEEHPETKLEGALAPLKDLAFDANPVVVIVEP